MKEQCSNCKFWDCDYSNQLENPDDAERICRRYPPKFILIEEYDQTLACQAAQQWAQPVTYGGDWCGEWKQKT